MKIKVAILEQDQNYQNRLMVALREKFPDKLEVIRCAPNDDVLKVIEEQEVKVFAINQMINVNLNSIPEECAVVIFSEMKDEKIEDYITICKYQRIYDIGGQLYKVGKNHDKLMAIKKEKERKELEARLERERKEEEERLKREKEEEEERKRLEAERLEKERREEEARIAQQKAREEEEKRIELERKRAIEEKIKARRRNPKIYAFISAQKDEGSSIASIACTINAQNEEYNILYLDLMQFGKMDRFFTPNATELNYKEILGKAIKGELKGTDVEKAVLTEAKTGINYIYNSECVYEIGALGREGFENLMKAIGEMEKYDIVVLNLEESMSTMTYAAIAHSTKTIFVGSGQHDSNSYLQRKIDAVGSYDKANGTQAVNNVNILYNRYDRKSTQLNIENVTVLGTIQVLKGTEAKVLEAMLKQDVLKNIIKFPE